MKIFYNYKDIVSSKDYLDKLIHDFLMDRFIELHKSYCPNGLTPLGQFSLEEYGEMILIEDHSEIEGLEFEDVTKFNLSSDIIYLASYLSNNEVCCDVVIQSKLLSQNQIEKLEREL